MNVRRIEVTVCITWGMGGGGGGGLDFGQI